jgi:hypothetical protein
LVGVHGSFERDAACFVDDQLSAAVTPHAESGAGGGCFVRA